MLEQNLKKTPLFEEHEKAGARIVDYAGWAMPVEYSGLQKEHEAVREAAGIFDVSHMGEFIIKGKDSEKFLNWLLTNDIPAMKDKQIAYNFMCYENGTVVDDLIVYKHGKEHFLLVVNAANADKDWQWIEEKSKGFDLEIIDNSAQTGLLALQGPLAEKILQKLTKHDLSSLDFFCFESGIGISNVPCLVSRSGYTGEDGFEIYTHSSLLTKLWTDILEAGQEEGLLPCGLGARDTLRFEAGLPLYGNELSDQITPLEAGLGFFVKLTKEDFIGKEALQKQKDQGLQRKIVAFELVDRGIARQDYEVFFEDKKIGYVTTGYMSPTLKQSLGLALIEAQYGELGQEIFIAVRNKKLKAKIRKKAFYQKNYKN